MQIEMVYGQYGTGLQKSEASIADTQVNVKQQCLASLKKPRPSYFKLSVSLHEWSSWKVVFSLKMCMPVISPYTHWTS